MSPDTTKCLEGKGITLRRVRLFVTPWTVARQAPLSMELSSRRENNVERGNQSRPEDPELTAAWFPSAMAPTFIGNF